MVATPINQIEVIL